MSKDQRFIRVMEGPCVFGELAILYHCERTATVIGDQSIYLMKHHLIHR